MGLFDFFGKKSPTSKVDKAVKKMLNEHQQQQVRQEAMQELVGMDTPEAISALIKRLGVNFRDTIKNEQEKRWVHDTLVNYFKDRAVEPLIAFIRTEQSVSAAILVLRKLCSDEMVEALLCEVLTSYSPEDHRTFEIRLQLVDALADYPTAAAMEASLPYLVDHDDGVRLKVLELIDGRIEKGHALYEQALEELIKVLKDPMASSAIARRSAEMISRFDADLRAHVDALAAFVPDGFILGTNGRLRKG
jgi:HEAT repeat protein